MEQFAVLILAAGSSERLGQPKQLLPFKDNNLLYYIASEALKVTKNVAVVLGSNAATIQEEIKPLPVTIVYNKDWNKGMSSSIRSGLYFFVKQGLKIEGLIILVSDQPYVSAELLHDMIEKFRETKKPIVACSYRDTAGVPVLFDKSFFAGLLQLEGQQGAKAMLASHRDLTATINFPLGHVDIDTPEDYENFKKIQPLN